MRDSTVFYRSFYEAIKDLDHAIKSQIYDAIFEYSFNKNELELSGVPKTIFTLIKPQLDANNRKFENGSKPKQKQNVSKKQAKRKQKTSKTEANVNVNVNVNDNVNNNVNEELECQFEETFKAYLKMRTKIKKPATDEAIKLTMEDLNKLSEGDIGLKIEILNQSIKNSWQGVFPLKNQYNSVQTISTKNLTDSAKKTLDVINQTS